MNAANFKIRDDSFTR